MVETRGNSYFDGGLLELVLYQLGASLLIVLTFGIAYPWALCMLYSWKIEHTVVEGKRLQFHGTGMGLLGKWIIWTLLTIVTFGIYSFWAGIALEKWKAENTTFQVV